MSKDKSRSDHNIEYLDLLTIICIFLKFKVSTARSKQDYHMTLHTYIHYLVPLLSIRFPDLIVSSPCMTLKVIVTTSRSKLKSRLCYMTSHQHPPPPNVMPWMKTILTKPFAKIA